MGLNCPDEHLQVNLIMLSYPRKAPPMGPTRSLEGLERVVPPGAAHYATTEPDLQLNKPLPAKPLVPATPDLLPQSAWSDDSSIESFGDHTESEDSTESYPISVNSGSDDIADQPPPPTDPLSPVESHPHDCDHDTPDPDDSSLALNAFLSEERYGSGFGWAQNQNRVGTSHYFREKKWDFFPELATPSALQNSTSSSLPPGPRNSKHPKKDAGRLNLPGWNRNRWHSEHAGGSGPGLAIAHGVRDSIRSYVHRTLSKTEKSSRQNRPVTAPLIYPCKTSTSLSDRSLAQTASQQNSLAMSDQSRSLSLSTTTDSSTNDHNHSRNSADAPARRPKQLAVPISPYQKYGASIWDKSGGAKKGHSRHRQVRFPKRQTTKRPPKHGANKYSTSAPTLSSLSPLQHQQNQQQRDYVKALHDGTSHVRDALDDAKRKVTESKADRRRERLKAQIKHVGPMNPRSNGEADPWM
ncbi:hypothetical protein PHISP_06152 [Aspergillus sp. HF37]|nr:hypothetical protein PHISP_06152 [Aspergillus sp. HF37]